MISAIKYNLTHLADFRGRDARSTFWFYVLFLVIVSFLLSIAISIPMTGAIMGDAIRAGGQNLSEAELQQRIFARMSAMMHTTMWLSVLVSLVMLGLVLAAFVRRLHDAGKPAWIAYLAAAIQLVALAMSVAAIDDAVQMVVLAQSGQVAEAQALRSHMMLQGLLSWIPTLLVIVFGIWPSDKSANAYGPPVTP